MQHSLVMTVIGPDRPGLVENLSKVIAAHQGSWQESRMAHLGGHFAGLLRVECPADQQESLRTDLEKLDQLTVTLVDELQAGTATSKTLRFDVMGNDRPGIVHQLSAAIASAGGNVEELSSNLESAAHAGHPLFHAEGTVGVAPDFDESQLIAALEALGQDLSVTVEA